MSHEPLPSTPWPSRRTAAVVRPAGGGDAPGPAGRLTAWLLAALAASVPLIAPHVTLAADASWNVNAAGTWITGTNWLGGIPGSTTSSTSTDIATFGLGITGGRTVTVDANRNVGGITFSNTSAFGYTIGTGNLLLTSGGVIQTTAGSGTNTINVPIAIQGVAGSGTFTGGAASATGVLTVGGSVTGVSTAGNTTTLTLNGGNTGLNVVSGPIGNGTAGGRLAVVKSGTGRWQLSGTNTFTGGITLNDGTLRVSNTASLGSTTGTLTINGGAFETIQTLTLGNYPQAWNGDFAYSPTGAFNLSLGAGAVTMSGSRTVTVNGQALTVGGTIGGVGASLTKAGAGQLTLSATNNTFTGGVNLNSGTLSFNLVGGLGSGTFTINGGAFTTAATGTLTTNNAQAWNGGFTSVIATSVNMGTGAVTLNASPVVNMANSSGALTIPGAIAGSGRGLTKAGPGILALSNAANSFTGPVTINAGTLRLSSIGNGGANGTLGASSSDAANLVIDGGTLDFSNASGTNNTDRLFTIGPAGATLNQNGASSSAVNFTNTGTIAFTGSGNRTLTLNEGNRAGSLAAVLVDPAGGSLSIARTVGNTTSGDWTLSGSNSFTGSITLTQGQLTANNPSALGNPSAIDFNGGTLRFAVAPATDYSAKFSTAASQAYNIVVDAGLSVTLAANLTSAAGTLSKSGAGILTLTGSNTFVSGSVSGGLGSTLQIGNTDALGTGTISLGDQTALASDGSTPRTITNPIAATSGNARWYLGSTAGTGDLTLTGPVTWANATAVASLTLQGLSQVTISGAIGGTSTTGTMVLQVGTGRSLTLSGNNSAWSATEKRLDSGTLILGHASALGTGTIVLNAAGVGMQASTDLSGANAVANRISQVTDATVSGTNNITFSGGWTHNQGSGGTGRVLTSSLAAGRTLTLSGTTALQESGTGVGRTFTVAGTGDTTFSGAIVNGGTAGNSSLTITNTGLTVLSGSNSFTGTLTASGGGVRLDTATAVPGGIGTAGGSAALTISGGVVILGDGDFSRGLGTTASTVRITTGGGFAAYGGDRNVNFGGDGTPAAVTWGVNNFMSTASGTLVLGHATADSKVTLQNPIVAGTSGAVSRTIQVNRGTGAVDAELSGVISQTAGTAALVKTGAGILTLTGNNTFLGRLQIGDGVVQATTINSTGSGPFGANATTDLGLGTTSGTLRWVGGTDTTVTRTFNLSGTAGGGGAIVADGAGALTIASVTASETGPKTLTFTGTSTALNTILAAIPDASGAAVAVVKDGPGRWRLTGTSSYAGGFTLKSGTVLVAADGASSGNSGVFGQGGAPVVGDPTATTGVAALLAEANTQFGGGVTVAAAGAGSTQTVRVGGINQTGTVTFDNDTDIKIGRDVTLVAATGGVVKFGGRWWNLDKTAAPTAGVTIGAPDFAGTVRLMQSGTLATNGSVAVRYGTATLASANTVVDGTGTLAIDAGATLGGIGRVAAPLGGAGLVAPGNSPGILTAEAFDPSGGLDLAFEFTGTAPTYTSGSASVNDILRLTGASPFLGQSLSGANVVSLYLPAAAATGGTFMGGFFTDQDSGSFANFLTTVASGSFVAYYADAGGAVSYGGSTYSPLPGGLQVQVGTMPVPGTTNFQTGGAATNGQVTTFTVAVPEPGALALAGIGLAVGGWWLSRRRR